MRIFVVVNSGWNIDMLRRDFILELKKREYEVTTSHDSRYLNLDSMGCPDLERNISISKLAKFVKSLPLNICDKESLTFSFTLYGNMITGLCLLLGLMHCRFFPTITGLGAPYSNIVTRVPYLLLMYFALIKSEKVFFHNEADLKLFTSFRITSRRKAILVDGGGVNKIHNKTLNYVTPTKIFGTIARAIPEKGLHSLVDCFNEKPLSNCQLLILSDLADRRNEYAFSLLRKISNMKNITLLNSKHDKSDFFSNINFFVLNSEREGRSRAIIESLSCGIPVVCRDVPGCNDIITDGVNGFLATSGQPIYFGILKALECSYEDWRSLSEKASASFKPYAVESIVDDYLKVLK